MLMQEMVSEFICFIMAEANDISIAANRKAVTAQDNTAALSSLDLAMFAPAVEAAMAMMPQGSPRMAASHQMASLNELMSSDVAGQYHRFTGSTDSMLGSDLSGEVTRLSSPTQIPLAPMPSKDGYAMQGRHPMPGYGYPSMQSAPVMATPVPTLMAAPNCPMPSPMMMPTSEESRSLFSAMSSGMQGYEETPCGYSAPPYPHNVAYSHVPSPASGWSVRGSFNMPGARAAPIPPPTPEQALAYGRFQRRGRGNWAPPPACRHMAARAKCIGSTGCMAAPGAVGRG